MARVQSAEDIGLQPKQDLNPQSNTGRLAQRLPEHLCFRRQRLANEIANETADYDVLA
jgi:hypothetical protein